MQTRDNMIQRLREQLGNQATIGDAESLFDFMRDRDQITFDERDGFELADDLDLFVAYDEMTRDGYRVVNADGMARIENFLTDFHKVFQDREPTKDELLAWAADAEQSGGLLEVRGMDSITGNPETMHLGPLDMDWRVGASA